MHVTPGDEFKTTVDRELDRLVGPSSAPHRRQRRARVCRQARRDAGDKLTRRLGWMTRAHPYVLDGTRLIVPLYSDGFSFSLMAITDDWGATWKASTPLVGFGNIQPSLARKKDGTLVAYMRDNGPAPKRLHVSRSRDRGETWSRSRTRHCPIRARALKSRCSRTAIGCSSTTISSRDATAWPSRCRKTRARRGRGRGTSSAIAAARRSRAAARRVSLSVDHPGQGRHAARHLQLLHSAGRATKDAEGRVVRKAIKHAHFNEAWIRARP